MTDRTMKRRNFMQAAAAGTAGLSLTGPVLVASGAADPKAKPALLGGKPVREKSFPSWPVIGQNDEDAWMEVLRAKSWCRLGAKAVSDFEKEFAARNGSKECLLVANGTSALWTSLNALDVGPGDEVIVTPYTFVATVNVIILQYALPVFVDIDPESFLMDPGKIEAAITERTRCILPVHLAGNVADLDRILIIGKKHNIPIVEDSCQAHMAEWYGQKVGTFGDAGCFSFQVSKNLPSGEGGAILTQNSELMDRCYSFHSNGMQREGRSVGPGYHINGANLRMTEFQGALLMAQIARFEEQSEIREKNASYLTERLNQIDGIAPAKMYKGCTRNAYHLYMLRYNTDRFDGLSREVFLKALRAEGIPCTGGYGGVDGTSPLNKEPFIKNALDSRGYRAIYSEDRIKEYHEKNHCPENDKLCREAIWFFQSMFLGEREDMDQIAEAILKIQAHAAELAKA